MFRLLHHHLHCQWQLKMKMKMKMITIFTVKVFDNRETWKLQASSKEEMEDWLDVLKRNLVNC